jgi:amidase
MPSSVDRRRFVAGAMPAGAALGALLGSAVNPAAAAAAATAAAAPGLLEQDVTTLQAQMLAGRLTSQALTRACLQRIAALNLRGPMLRAVIELNPDAIAQAKALDAERRGGRTLQAGVRGPLHGIPVLLKDNIATADKMATTAGSLALAGLHARRDAHIVQRLRDAGAVILGKTNLSEWANIRSTRSTSGWSSRGGQTRNPHVLNRNTSGSSSGSGAAIAAGLAPLAVGTETDGSITSPATTCGIVGFKPTLGLVSRDGIIPIAASQDTAGPMTRSVRDAALLLQVLAGSDARDSATATLPPELLKTDFAASLRPDALRGARIGVIRASVPPQPGIAKLFEQALAVLAAQGALLVDPLQIANQDKYSDTELAALLCELKDGLPAYLRDFQPDAPVRDLASLMAWNRQNAARVMPFFDQELLEQAEATQGTAGQPFKDALATNRRYARTEGIDALFTEHRLDAVVAPTGNLAWPIDPLLGDHFTAGGFTSPFAVAGYPHLSVPMGLVHDLPVGLSFGGLAWQDARVLALGHAYEQASQARRAPRFLRDIAPL